MSACEYLDAILISLIKSSSGSWLAVELPVDALRLYMKLLALLLNGLSLALLLLLLALKKAAGDVCSLYSPLPG